MASEPSDNGSYEKMQTVTLRIFANHEVAQLAAANLTAHGIKCWVSADDCGGMYPNLTAAGGVRLMVCTADAEAAENLLNTPASTSEINQIELAATAAAPPGDFAPMKIAWGQMLFGVVIGVVLYLLFQWNDKRGTKTYSEQTSGGKQSEAWVYRDGQPEKFMQDRNLDGAWDYWIYFENGQMVRSEFDDNFDGKPDEFWVYSNNLPVAQEIDTDFNGLTDEFCTFQNGVIQRLDIRPDESKFTTTCEIFTNGVVAEIWRGGDSNGNFSEVVRYDAFFNPICTNHPDMFRLPFPLTK